MHFSSCVLRDAREEVISLSGAVVVPHETKYATTERKDTSTVGLVMYVRSYA